MELLKSKTTKELLTILRIMDIQDEDLEILGTSATEYLQSIRDIITSRRKGSVTIDDLDIQEVTGYPMNLSINEGGRCS